MQLVGGILLTMCLCQGGTPNKSNRMWLEGVLTIKTFCKEVRKLVVGVASVVCVVTCRYPKFMIFGIMQEYCRRLLVQCIVEFI